MCEKIGKTYHTYPYKKGYALKTTHWYQMQYSDSQDLVPQTEEGITEAHWIKPKQISDILLNTHEL